MSKLEPQKKIPEWLFQAFFRRQVKNFFDPNNPNWCDHCDSHHRTENCPKLKSNE